jgi:hypothetical protein
MAVKKSDTPAGAMAEAAAPAEAEPTPPAPVDVDPRDAELARLARENAALKAKLEELGGSAAAALAAPSRPRFLMNEGARAELEERGSAVDAATGGIFKKDAESGEVTFTDRATGKETKV